MVSNKDLLNLTRIKEYTEFRIETKNKTLRYAFNLVEDPKKEERLGAGLCVVCFYGGPFIGGRAMTQKECECCSTNMVFSSTTKDRFCLPCAKKYDLCKHCSCEVNLKIERLANVNS